MNECFVLAGGGTGGHVYPALAIAQELRRQSPHARIHFVGGRRGIEGRLVPEAGFALTRLPASGLRGRGVVGAASFALAFLAALLIMIVLLLRWRPAVVLATGGYASAAPAIAAALLRRPLWLQEQNSVPGSTNRVLSRFAERIYVAFEESIRWLKHGAQIERTPNPVRAEIRQQGPMAATAEDFAAFDLEPGRPTVLIFGGSRGARRLGEAFRQAWEFLREDGYWQFLLQAGEQELASTRAVVRPHENEVPRARVLSYVDDMAAAYRIADLIVCRAGAMTLAELAAVGKPSILVPFPHATDDHQTRNAAAFVTAGAATLIPDAELDGTRLRKELHCLAKDGSVLGAMTEAARKLDGTRNAAGEIATAMLRRSKGGRPS